MKITAVLLLSIVCIPGFAQTDQPSWQSSFAPVVELGIRDKYGSSGSYQATFFVEAPSGTVCSAPAITVTDDAWGFTSFPTDFNPGMEMSLEQGQYRWWCEVQGKKVIEGKFDIKITTEGKYLIQDLR
jgi:hypothetical protein